ncbi:MULTISPECIES: hypothetical protein [Bacillaceae]|uniref:Secreted protein n=1 Tax=Metabacillus sediminis TaxID=3117746 RepID=A0ABZ2NKB8_9BACI|nr:hypothetical protein [Bacillus sp. SJS]KZZ83607.1 hypothetical protein AS29_014955 [Bacillus sp. SJS]
MKKQTKTGGLLPVLFYLMVEAAACCRFQASGMPPHRGISDGLPLMQKVAIFFDKPPFFQLVLYFNKNEYL